MGVLGVHHPRDEGEIAAGVSVDGSALRVSAGEYASGVEVGFVDADGVERSGPLACWWGGALRVGVAGAVVRLVQGAEELHW